MAFALKDACNVLITSRTTNKPFLYADYLNSCSLSVSSEPVFARAKGMNKITFDGAKTGTFTMETEIFELKYLALILGGKVSKEAGKFAKRHVGSVDGSGKITLPEKPVTGSISTFVLGKDNKEHIKEVVTAPEVSEKELTYSGGDAPKEGEKIAIYYLVEVPNATKISVTDEVNSDAFKIEGITAIRNEFNEDELFQLRIFNAKPQTNAEITMSAENVSSFSATFDLMVDENNEMIELLMLPSEEPVTLITAKRK